MCFTGDGVGKFSIKCTTQHRPVSSIKTTTSRPPASRLIYMSSNASLKESSVAVNVKKGTYPSPKYALKNSNIENIRLINLLLQTSKITKMHISQQVVS